MLPAVREEIVRAAKEAGAIVTELGPQVADKIRSDLLAKYGKDRRFEFCCDNIDNYMAVQHPTAWRWIGEFVKNDSVLLFYDSSHNTKTRPDRSAFLIPDGGDLTRLLENCYGFVFYVTDAGTDYVLCYNQHDYLIGAGRAKEWVGTLLPRHESWAQSLNGKLD